MSLGPIRAKPCAISSGVCTRAHRAWPLCWRGRDRHQLQPPEPAGRAGVQARDEGVARRRGVLADMNTRVRAAATPGGTRYAFPQRAGVKPRRAPPARPGLPGAPAHLVEAGAEEHHRCAVVSACHLSSPGDRRVRGTRRRSLGVCLRPREHRGQPGPDDELRLREIHAIRYYVLGSPGKGAGWPAGLLVGPDQPVPGASGRVAKQIAALRDGSRSRFAPPTVRELSQRKQRPPVPGELVQS